ncbi:MAG: hypothetical protein ACPGJV_02935 [Bacteriovoracaceae bacterium]
MNKYYILLITILCSCGLVEPEKKENKQESSEPQSTYRHRNLNELDRNWKARALQAEEFLETITKRLDNNELSDYEECKYMLESAFYQRINPNNEAPLKYESNDGVSYALTLLPYSLEKNQDTSMAVVAFHYDKNGNYYASSFKTDGTYWEQRKVLKIQWGYFLISNGCSYFIDEQEPFRIKAIERKEMPII